MSTSGCSMSIYSRGLIRFHILHMCEMSSLYVLQVCSLSTFECQGRLWMQLTVKVFKLQQPGLALGSCQMTCLLISGRLSFPNMSDPSVSPYLVFHDISIYFIWRSQLQDDEMMKKLWTSMGLWLWTMLTSKHHKNDALFIYLVLVFHLFNAWAENCSHRSQKNRRVPESHGDQPYFASCHCPVTLLRRSLLVLGRSGSGKSTLLRALLKKQFPDYTGPLHFGSSEIYCEEISIPIFWSVERLDSPSNEANGVTELAR